LIKPIHKIIDDWNQIIETGISVAEGTNNKVSTEDIANSLHQLSDGFRLQTDAAVLQLLYYRLSNYSSIGLIPATATFLQRQIRVFQYSFTRAGIQIIYNPRNCLVNTDNAAGNYSFFHTPLITYMLVYLFT